MTERGPDYAVFWDYSENVSLPRLVVTPLPPLANRLWRRGWKRTRKGMVPVTYKTTEAEQWQEIIGWKMRAVLRAAGMTRWERDHVVQIWLWFPDARRRDADGPIKLLLDTLALGMEIDDRYFLPRVMAREIDRERPRVELLIEPVEGRAEAELERRRTMLEEAEHG